jgi:uncharacterized membrane protein
MADRRQFPPEVVAMGLQLPHLAPVFRPRRGPTGNRVLIGSLLGGAAGVVAAFEVAWQATVLIAWSVACLFFLISTWSGVGPKSPADTKANALSGDPSVPLADLVICTAAITCIVGAGFALSLASSSVGTKKAGLIALSVLGTRRCDHAGRHTGASRSRKCAAAGELEPMGGTEPSV